MKNAHIVGVALLAGFILGCCVPAHALPVMTVSEHIEGSFVTGIDSETCVISLENDTHHDVDCDDLSLFDEGDFVKVLVRDGVTVLIDEVNGAKVITND